MPILNYLPIYLGSPGYPKATQILWGNGKNMYKNITWDIQIHQSTGLLQPCTDDVNFACVVQNQASPNPETDGQPTPESTDILH